MAKLQRVLVVLSLFLAPVLFAQSADQEVVSVVDAPDPVTPGSTLSYTVTIRNNGPDAAVKALSQISRGIAGGPWRRTP